MNRDDWVFVGVRLFGVFILFWAIVDITTGVAALLAFDIRFLVALVIRLIVGWMMARRTAMVCAWLGAQSHAP